MQLQSLDKLVVSLTVTDRKNKNKPMAKKWIARGFGKITKQRLVEYWQKRIEQYPEDFELYSNMLMAYQKTVKPAQSTPEDKTAPGLWSMMKTAAEAGKNFVKSGMRFVTVEQFNEREAICKGCEYWNPKGYANTGQCLKCGCATKAKLKLASESCPLKKWNKIEPSPQEHQ